MYNIIEALEKQAPGYTYGLDVAGHIFVNGKKTEVTLTEVSSDAPQEAIEEAAAAAKNALIAGSYVKK